MSQSSNETLLKKEEAILAEEKTILKEVKTEEQLIKKAERRITLLALLLGLVVVLSSIGLTYWHYASTHVQIDNSLVTAPRIELSAATPGILQEIEVHEGDIVGANAVVARVDNQIIKTKIGGLVIKTNDNIGKRVNPSDVIVSLIDPSALRVVGQLGEDKGLASVQVGQRATFTVDAFGSKTFYGTVDEVSPTSHEGDVVFNISDKRQTQEFDVKVRYDVGQYPELKNGMSAKITVLTN